MAPPSEVGGGVVKLRHLASVMTVVAIMAAAGLPVPAVGDHEPYTTHAQLQELLVEWEAAGAEVATVATSRQGRDIPMVRLGDGPVTVLVTAVLHANEPSGTEASVRLISLLLGDDQPTFDEPGWSTVRRSSPALRALTRPRSLDRLLQRVTLVVLPMLDPDGVSNGHTRDTSANTDYATQVTVQADAIGYVMEHHRPDLLVDLHGGPDEPLNIGLIEPQGVEPAVRDASRDAATTLWRAADGSGIPVKYFEEHPLALITGQHGDPAASIDETYYSALARVAPLTWESLQLEGIPTVYTETVGLQSRDPQISILEGASIQQVTTLALLFDAAGLFDGVRPRKRSATADQGAATTVVRAKREITGLRATVAWPWHSTPQDWTVRVIDERTGDVVAERAADATPAPNRRARSVLLGALPAGRYRVEASSASPAAQGVLTTLWHVPARQRVRGVLGPAENVALCLDGESLFRTAVSATDPTAFLAAPTCEQD
jgi:hypothetical protein